MFLKWKKDGSNTTTAPPASNSKCPQGQYSVTVNSTVLQNLGLQDALNTVTSMWFRWLYNFSMVKISFSKIWFLFDFFFIDGVGGLIGSTTSQIVPLCVNATVLNALGANANLT